MVTLFIALESVTKVNKTAVALFLSVACWVCYMCSFGQYVNGFRLPEFQKYLSTEGLTNSLDSAKQFVDSLFVGHLGDTCETIFFLMGAMTIVEIVDSNGGFNFVRDLLNTKSKKKLLWQIAFATFFISSVLDNLTTSIVMIMILRKLVSDQKERMLYAGIVILAANAGGAFSDRRCHNHHVVDKGLHIIGRSHRACVPPVGSVHSRSNTVCANSAEWRDNSGGAGQCGC